MGVPGDLRSNETLSGSSEQSCQRRGEGEIGGERKGGERRRRDWRRDEGRKGRLEGEIEGEERREESKREDLYSKRRLYKHFREPFRQLT